MRASAARERELAAAAAERELAEARAELRALRDEIRSARRREQQARRAPLPARRRARSGSATAGSARPPSGRRGRSSRSARSTSRSQLQAPLAAGDPVEAPALGVRGTIAAIEGDEAEVVGAGRPPDPDPRRAARARRRAAAPSTSEPEPAVRVVASARGDVSDELDVRGRRAQEAREAVRAFVDDAALAGLPLVRVVHGRGTGAVRAAVREELDGHPLVERRESDSADGATVVHLAAPDRHLRRFTGGSQEKPQHFASCPDCP